MTSVFLKQKKWKSVKNPINLYNAFLSLQLINKVFLTLASAHVFLSAVRHELGFVSLTDVLDACCFCLDPNQQEKKKVSCGPVSKRLFRHVSEQVVVPVLHLPTLW